jgi:hypothetical protein
MMFIMPTKLAGPHGVGPVGDQAGYIGVPMTGRSQTWIRQE